MQVISFRVFNDHSQVLLIVGIYGACRRQELTNLSTKNITDEGDFVIIKIVETKTHHNREFTITHHLNIFRKYSALRTESTKHDRFFVNYRNGKCSSQPVGINTIGGIPKVIAEYLNLKDPHLYTGHCFRRSSASILADCGASMSTIKRFGGWKSTVVAEGYIESSLGNKCRVANNILGNEISQMPSTSTAVRSVINQTSSNDPNIVNISQQITAVQYEKVNVASQQISVNNNNVKLPLMQNCTLNNCTINYYTKCYYYTMFLSLLLF